MISKSKFKTTQVIILLLIGLLLILVLFFYLLFYKVNVQPVAEIEKQNQLVSESQASEKQVFLNEGYESQVKNLISEYLLDNITYQELQQDLLDLKVPVKYQDLHLQLVFKSVNWTKSDWQSFKF